MARIPRETLALRVPGGGDALETGTRYAGTKSTAQENGGFVTKPRRFEVTLDLETAACSNSLARTVPLTDAESRLGVRTGRALPQDPSPPVPGAHGRTASGTRRQPARARRSFGRTAPSPRVWVTGPPHTFGCGPWRKRPCTPVPLEPAVGL